MHLSSLLFRNGARCYVIRASLVRGGAAGRVLTAVEADVLIASMLRSSEAVTVRRMFERLSGTHLSPSTTNEVVRRWLSAQLKARLVIIELSGADAPADTRTQKSPELRKEEEAARDVVRSVPGEFIHAGEGYRLVESDAHLHLPKRDSFEALSARDAIKVLKEASPQSRSESVRKGLEQATALLEQQVARNEAPVLLLLRRARSYVRETKAPSAAMTPSQIRKSQLDWIRITFVDDNNQPMANEAYKVTLADSSTQSGTLDSNGMTYIPGIAKGVCSVEFPDFKPRQIG